jgi:hypothetical protein
MVCVVDPRMRCSRVFLYFYLLVQDDVHTFQSKRKRGLLGSATRILEGFYICMLQ